MLLAWLQTILVVSNMLLAKAYGSGGCFWDNGHLYRADQPSPAPGLLCLNWLDAQSGPVSAPESETTFQGLPTSTTETEEMSEVPGGDEVQVFAPANTLPAQSEAAAVQPVIGISQRVRVNSKEKKDLGTLGYVLGVTMMVIIIGIGAGIVLGYTYKRSKGHPRASVFPGSRSCPSVGLQLLEKSPLGTRFRASHQQIPSLKWIFGNHVKIKVGGLPGGTAVESPPADAGDMGSSPDLGRSHMPQSNWARKPQLLSLRVWSLCSTTREATTVRGPCTAMKSGPRLPQLEKALAQKRRPNTVKNKNK
ncbi:phosphoinositide-3-kinase-interacting protein 1 isoform X2 [Lagenorhynchus albirostris]|uniref:phosphoinositide-3-kinase-interacting protein 1 isoform X2 n=1 Tax=Lagenorhynchus albirostris TaxID=27610 RepID=UPI0028E991A4|nr:phosphoinositide-3-kinase-interacting protein 1 isoform X2 [Lagenorhynchus albirostris]